MADPITIAKAAAVLLTNEKTRKGIGWVLAAVLSPALLVLAFLFVLASGGASSNIEAVRLCFHGGEVPDSYAGEYREYIQEMRDCFSRLDAAMEELGGEGIDLDRIRVKAVFFSLYFGADDPASVDARAFVDCFVAAGPGKDGGTRAIEDLEQVYENLKTALGVEIGGERRSNADSVYQLIKYGYVGGGGAAFDGAEAPYIGVDGFCSPVGANWRDIVTSEFGGRLDPITGKRDGHTGMDLAVPVGTPIRAALDGVVAGAQNAGRMDSYDAAQKMGIALKKGWLSHLFRVIVDKAREFLQGLIRQREMPPKPTLDIDMEEFQAMRSLLIKVTDEAGTIRGLQEDVPRLEQQLAGMTGIFKGRERKALSEQIAQTKAEISCRLDALPAIVQAEGYPDVQTFKAAYRKAESIVDQYNQDMAEWERKVRERRRPARAERLRPPERESVRQSLRQLQAQGRQSQKPRQRSVDMER